MTTTLILFSFASGIAARRYAPSAWVAGKRWLGRKLFPQINS